MKKADRFPYGTETRARSVEPVPRRVPAASGLKRVQHAGRYVVKQISHSS